MMKYLFNFVLAFFFFVMSSCSKDNNALESKDLTLNVYPQTWKLIKMTGSLAGSQSVGQDMAWQENYVFKADGTFLKTRITEGESESASGSYIFDNDNQDFFLDYDNSNNIIGNCSPDSQEYLYFHQDGKTLLSNWWACDGPGLFYERIK